MSGKRRLIEWAMWRLEPMFYVPIATTMGRIQDDEENAGAGNEGFHYDMVGPTDNDPESLACMPDGGMGDMIDRMAGAIEHDRRCREIDELVTELRHRSRDFWNLVDVTFSGTHPRDVEKEPEVCAKIMGVERGVYSARMRAVYEWVEGRIGGRRRAA